MLPIPPTIAPLAAAELIAIWVALPWPRTIWQGELWATPPVIAPGTLPVIQLLVSCPVVCAGRASTVGITGTTVTPLGAAGILTTTVTLRRSTIRQWEVLATSTVNTNTPNNKLNSLGNLSPKKNVLISLL